jgi:hypothetical protein
MLENLLRTYVILAPDEIVLQRDVGLYIVGEWTEYPLFFSLETIVWPYKNLSLQGYIQQCIEAKNWAHKIIVDNNHGEHYASAQLNAYLSVLAAQRPVAPGKWQHFKGGEIDVVGAAFWASGQHESNDYVPLVEADFVGEFVAEEEPQKSLKLYKQGENLFYISWQCICHSDRVFYSHDNKNWARTVDSFLGLVGVNHLEHEGKLRFIYEIGERDA